MNATQLPEPIQALHDAWHALRDDRDELCRRILTLEVVLHRVLEHANPLDAVEVREQLQRVRANVTNQDTWDALDLACTTIAVDAHALGQ